MSRRSKDLLVWLPVAAWSALIFYASSLPTSRLPGRIPSEFGHLGEYAVLGALLFLALRRSMPAGRAAALAVVVASIFGVTDEFHQHFVPTRTPDPYDWATDTLGALVGALSAWWLTRIVARRRHGGETPAQSPRESSLEQPASGDQ